MAGIYLHIPFCKTRCIYCDFFSSVSMEKRIRYIDALCKELYLRKDFLSTEKIETIYFGGGTPSLLQKDDFLKIFTRISENKYFIENDNEITIEANPDDLSFEYLESLTGLSLFNRISIGIQSFHNEELHFLNRRHNAEKATQAVKNSKNAGFENISIDLMYGLPGQTLRRWKENLYKAIDLDVQHISAYHLIYEEGTRLHKMLKDKNITPADEELSVEMFSEMIEILTSVGFEHYEISNFAKPGFVSKHNSSYWDGTSYLGVGASAHSFNGKERNWNVSDLNKYINSIEQGILPVETEIIGKIEAYNDFILTRMRTMKGMDLGELESLFGEKMKEYCLRQSQKHINNQTVDFFGNRLKLTKKGIFISDGIMSDLFR